MPFAQLELLFAHSRANVPCQHRFDLVCGSPTLKEETSSGDGGRMSTSWRFIFPVNFGARQAHAKKTNPALANMFDGCAGLYLQVAKSLNVLVQV